MPWDIRELLDREIQRRGSRLRCHALADNAPLTIAAAKAITAEILKPSPDLDRDRCNALIRACFDSQDYAEGRTAFMQKRKPVFVGK